VAEVFAAALEHPSESRAAFLAGACAGNAALLTEVHSLLRSHGVAGEFLTPHIAPGPPLSPSLLAAIDRASPSIQFPPGAHLGNRYRVRSVLGSGGAGDVYEAWDEELSIPVALKTLRFGAAFGEGVLRQLKQEAMLARAVVHPNVCRVYDLSCHRDPPRDDVWFLTMEVLRGETLAERLRSTGRMMPEAAWPLVEQMAAGLDAAHQAGIAHLDFKSGNVMLAGEPGREQAVITDFGLARTVLSMEELPPAPGQERPQPAPIVGTPAYMAPEQVQGEAAGPAADIYALGVVLYEIVTGALPFTGETPLEMAERRLAADAPSPRAIAPDLDERWEVAIRRCLEREPRRRFARASDVARALAGRVSVPAETAADSPPLVHSLPAERDRFVGRDRELPALAGIIAGGARVVTLLGAGGMGKTRLAVRYGWQSLSDWPGGVWFCDLTAARDENGIVSTAGKSLNVPLGTGSPVEQLGHVIRARGRCLVILDNAEQVARQVATMVRQWAERAPHAVFLVTSRERLGADHESVLDLEPMSLEAGLNLFIERAKWLRPGLELGAAEMRSAEEVVRLVEGIPLAIELAAARIRVMSPEQLVAGMRRRFSLLTGGRNERHATLVAAIDGSWELLDPWEQAALAQCSVFEGGFTLAAAESVLELGARPDAPAPIDVIQSLLNKSLLRSWTTIPPRGGPLAPRFGMFASIQEYARAKLAAEGAIPGGESGATAMRAAEERHGRWCSRFGDDEAIAALDRNGGTGRRFALGHEIDNLAAAARRAIARADGATATASYRASWEALSSRGPYRKAVELGREILAVPLADAERGLVLITLAQSEKDSGQTREARDHFAQAVELLRAAGHRRGEGIALGGLAGLDCEQGRLEEARRRFEAALSIHRELGDDLRESVVLANLGTWHRIQGRMDEARAYFEAALERRRRAGNRRGEGLVLANLGNLHYGQGRIEAARRHYDAALVLFREVGDRRGEGDVIANLGNLACDEGRLEDALAHYRAGLAIYREVGHRRSEGMALANLGYVHEKQGALDPAVVDLEASLGILREVGDRNTECFALGVLATTHRREGRIDAARACLETLAAIHQVLGNAREEAAAREELAGLPQPAPPRSTR
jgi:predicted ATPase